MEQVLLGDSRGDSNSCGSNPTGGSGRGWGRMQLIEHVEKDAALRRIDSAQSSACGSSESLDESEFLSLGQRTSDWETAKM